MSSITIKAHQLHYLGTDGNHGFELPEEEYIVRGNTQPLNSTFTFTNGEPIINYNYNSLANEHNNLEIPYFDVTGDGLINVVDIIAVVNHIIGNQPLTAQQKQKLRFRSDGTLKNNNIINVIDIISIISPNSFSLFKNCLISLIPIALLTLLYFLTLIVNLKMLNVRL